MGNGRTGSIWKSRNTRHKDSNAMQTGNKEGSALENESITNSKKDTVDREKIWNGLYDSAKNITWEDDRRRLQQSMGMNGNEFSYNADGNGTEGIVLSQMSFAANVYLNTGKLPDYANNPSWHPFTKQQIEATIKMVDNNARPIPESLTGIRTVRADALSSFLNDPRINDSTIDKFISNLKNNPSQLHSFNDVIKTLDYTQKGHTAFGLNSKRGSISSLTNNRPVRLEMVTAPRIRGCITNNSAENEVILSKGVRYHFVNARVETMTDHTGRKRDQLVLKVYMTQ